MRSARCEYSRCMCLLSKAIYPEQGVPVSGGRCPANQRGVSQSVPLFLCSSISIKAFSMIRFFVKRLVRLLNFFFSISDMTFILIRFFFLFLIFLALTRKNVRDKEAVLDQDSKIIVESSTIKNWDEKMRDQDMKSSFNCWFKDENETFANEFRVKWMRSFSCALIFSNSEIWTFD
jgi:hypothetical protein